MCLFLGVAYVLVLWGFAKFAGPNHGNAAVVTSNGKVVGADNVGQLFTQDIYFWGRPSCAGDDGYDASSSSGSNKGPTDSAYLVEVDVRIDSFMMHHPYLQRSQVSAEMVTVSGSGLDSDISPESAYVQLKLVADARGISEETVRKIVDEHIQSPLLGFMGPKKVNVLKLNVALDEMKK